MITSSGQFQPFQRIMKLNSLTTILLCINSSTEYNIDPHVILLYTLGPVTFLHATACENCESIYFMSLIEASIKPKTTQINKPVACVIDGYASLYVLSPIPEMVLDHLPNHHEST